MLNEHPALQSLRPYWASYQAMLKSVDEGQRFKASPKETYAHALLIKIKELEHDVQTMRLAVAFVRDISPSVANAAAIYRYHEEYFLCRLTACMDKAHRLVGAALLLKQDKCEGKGGQLFVLRAIQASHPELAASLERAAAIEAKHKKDRKALGDGLPVLSHDFLTQEAESLDALSDKTTAAIEAVLSTLAPIFELACA
ncbi:hypothetical protein [Janthinobacterium sp. B9-8]|uniref:hypothetical protein n=1 Tax=Janthinobacterium sp. B9-8 TaxID=1236179 RepID=UPI000AD02233|nr:hypothetical protein [Janthinobacterium sp. B9-8]